MLQGQAGFTVYDKEKVRLNGEHGGAEMTLQCWDDPAAKTMTLVVGNHKLPGAGFLLSPDRPAAAGFGQHITAPPKAANGSRALTS